MKLYEIECQRTNVTPKAFFEYCRNQADKKGIDIEIWINYEDWINPSYKEEYHINNHEDWEEPKREVIKSMPYDMQMYMQNSYNIIMEFQFDTETKGYGYLYMVEYKRQTT